MGAEGMRHHALTVTPAKAGVSCRKGARYNHKTPAFAGVTESML